ncbi:MAG: BT_3928 family protein [Bacteroidales bacterium]
MKKKFLIEICRYLTGAVFVFSGFVKGVDPLGTTYKIEDYFVVYGTEWANGLALSLSIILCATEFSIGLALLTKVKMKITAWLLMLMLVFFTGITFYDALFSLVPDCGCFGNAITLTNWETFFKNLVLIAFAFVVFRYRNEYRNELRPTSQIALFTMYFAGFIMFSIYNIRHLPMIDFTVWKNGTEVLSAKVSEDQVFVTYSNISTGEEKEFLSPNYPWNDSLWMREWKFKNQRVVTTGNNKDFGLLIEDESGNDLTHDLLSSEKMWLITIPDIQGVGKVQIEVLLEWINQIETSGGQTAIVSGSLPEEIQILHEVEESVPEVFYADATVLKTMVRSNPGIVLFDHGKLICKWHFNDLPEKQEIIMLQSKLP